MSAETKIEPVTDLVGRVYMRPREFKDPEVYFVEKRRMLCEDHVECYYVKCTNGVYYHIPAEDIH